MLYKEGVVLGMTQWYTGIIQMREKRILDENSNL